MKIYSNHYLQQSLCRNSKRSTRTINNTNLLKSFRDGSRIRNEYRFDRRITSVDESDSGHTVNYRARPRCLFSTREQAAARCSRRSPIDSFGDRFSFSRNPAVASGKSFAVDAG